jgi:RNA polymerase sigma-70 factor (ECF subfamily)
MDISFENKNIELISQGNTKAFELIFLYYQPKLVYFLNGFIKDEELARDMAQDIFLSVWNNREKLPQVTSFKAYIFRIGKNAICNYYDHSIVEEKYEIHQLSRPIQIDSIEEGLFAKELQTLIEIAVSNMPPQRRLVYQLSRVDGLTNSEIAEKLHIDKRTVQNHLSSALSDIRKVIKCCLIFFL